MGMMMTGQELLQIQKVGLRETSQEMATLMAVPLELYLEWIDPNNDCNPSVRMVLKMAKLVNGDIHSSLLEAERVAKKEKLYRDGEVLQVLLNRDLDDCNDEDVPLHQEKLGILQRLISGLLHL